jgi:hypothetical protein
MAMGERGLRLVALAALFLPALARPREVAAWAPWQETGRLVRVSVEVDGRPSPLYPAPDGSLRRYLEARPGSSYALRLENRTGERLGVVMNVDGLNAISGIAAAPALWHGPGRMYVLDPWGETVVRGWRTSLDEVRRFTFVDESVSYAARTGQANPKMGWIELAVYRERRPRVMRRPLPPWEPYVHDDAERRGSAEGESHSPAAPEATPPPRARDEAKSSSAARAPRSGYPGTGWGGRSEDRAEVVSFVAEASPAEAVTIRYEYAGALQALGVLPWPDDGRDRLRERERGERGFAAPPAW